MLRLIHNQTVQGGIVIDDIDDGLPNKQVHRLGSTADPKAYKRDGYANEPKQKCYIPRTHAANTSLPGYIDLKETQRVTLSAGKGKIAGLVQSGLISMVSLVESDLAEPVITTATIDAPDTGDITIAGTGFLSVQPQTTSVHLTGAGVGDVTLTMAQIIAVSPGAVTDTEIIIDATLVPSLAAGDEVTVTADAQTSDPEEVA